MKSYNIMTMEIAQGFNKFNFTAERTMRFGESHSGRWCTQPFEAVYKKYKQRGTHPLGV